MTRLFDLVPGWAWALAVAALSVATLHQWSAAVSARAEVDRMIAKAAVEREASIEEARLRERAAQAEADRYRSQKNAELENIDRRLGAALRELRARPARPEAGASVPEVAIPGQGSRSCSGSGLFREDAEFLAREAARADRLRAALRECYGTYDAASVQAEQPEGGRDVDRP